MVSVRLRLIGMRGSVFRPEFFYWRLVLTLRKLCEVAVALMFSSKPLFQAWYVPYTRDSGSGASAPVPACASWAGARERSGLRVLVCTRGEKVFVDRLCAPCACILDERIIVSSSDVLCLPND